MRGPLGGPATTTVADQLPSLLAALAQRGVHYAPVAIQRNSDFEFPALDPVSGTLFDARLTDFDVVLARTDLPISELKIEQVTMQHFTSTLVFTILGQMISVPRGWIAVDVKLRGKPYRLVDTHLESIDFTTQIAQALELVNGPTLAEVPVVLAGDINSDADSADPVLSASYHALVNAGLEDFWPTIHPGDPGFTNPLHGEDPFTIFYAQPEDRRDPRKTGWQRDRRTRRVPHRKYDERSHTSWPLAIRPCGGRRIVHTVAIARSVFCRADQLSWGLSSL